MDDLVIGIRDLRVGNEVLEHKSVLYLADTQQGMIHTVLVLHLLYDLRHIGNLLLILHFGPFVGTVRKKFRVILDRVVIYVEEILKVVESDDIRTAALLLGIRTPAEKRQSCQYYDYLLHFH